MKSELLSIIENICGKTNVDFESVDLIENGILDSLNLFSLVSKINEEFCINIGIEDIDPVNFSSIDSIIELIERKKG